VSGPATPQVSTRPGLPDGYVVRLRDDVRVTETGLLGGTPLRVLRLRGRARDTLVDNEIPVVDDLSRQVADRLLAANLAVPVVGSLAPVPVDQVTVVVPIRDRAARLDALLAHLGRDLTVIVVDDASDDPDAITAVATRHGARLVALATNLGPAGARNAGLEEVRTPYAALVDSDVLVDAATLTGLAAHFADPQLAAVAPRVRALPGRRTHQRWESRWLGLDRGPVPALVTPWSSVSFVPSACLVARTDVLRAARFDSRLRVGEDVDLVWRLLADGHRVRYDPASAVLHDSRPTVRSWLSQRFAYGTSAAPLAARHGTLVAPAVLSPATAATAVALLARRRWSAPLVAFATGTSAIRIRGRLRQSPHATSFGTRLALTGLVTTADQVVALTLRHWWPLTALAATRSRRARRTLLLAATYDAVRRREGGPVATADAALARRVDDLAYGAGLWWGALRQRSPRALLPTRVRSTRSSSPIDRAY
jgi:mycofactocin system glycosyltransferase